MKSRGACRKNGAVDESASCSAGRGITRSSYDGHNFIVHVAFFEFPG